MAKGYFVMVEGLDGSGKGIAVSGLRDYFISQGKKVFDLREHWKENPTIPEISEIMEYDVICSCEPTYSFVGKAIRDELIRNSLRKYSGMTTAHAFSLDREILYKKLILPAIKEGKIVIQERGVPTSLVYQPIQNETINLKEIINLPGNKLAIKSAPDLLIIVRIEPIETMNRLKERHKNDNAIFENLVFQQKAQVRFESDWLNNLFTSFGSKIVYLDTNPPFSVEDTKKKAVDIYLANSQKNI
jgi:dTMP kinase